MKVDALIAIVERRIHDDFYRDRDREFFRDRLFLRQAIARYGFECNSRGWQFSAEDICKELLSLLEKMRRQKDSIEWLPRYLESTVDRHLRLRADELNERGKAGRNIINNTISGIKPAAVREATPVETLDALYKDLKQRRRKRKTAKLPTAKQTDLLL
jgi:hypothetical protein